jgi:amino acid transporter
VVAVGVAWILLMTLICYIGIELNARTQKILLTFEVVILAVFAVVALIDVYANHPAGSMHVGASWFSPFAIHSWNGLINGVLLGLFIYWGWDSGVAVNEESRERNSGPGRAAVMSTIALVLIYVVVATAAQAYAGTDALSKNSSDVLSFLGGKVFSRPFDLLLIIAVLTSAAASTQTTILPTARTSLSMAHWGALPKIFGRINPRFQTPDVSTLVMGGLSVIWFVVIALASKHVLADSATALGFLIAFYYGLTGLACVVFFRRELLKSVKNFLLLGLAPLIGALMLLGIFVKAAIFYGHRANNSSPDAFGVGLIDVIGIGALLVGAVLMLLAWRNLPDFFKRRAEVAGPAALHEPAPPSPPVAPAAGVGA